MNPTLAFSIAILALGLVGIFNYGRVSMWLDRMLNEPLGRAAKPVKYVILIVLALLFVGALYAVVMWMKDGTVMTVDQSLQQLGQDAVNAADDSANAVGGYVSEPVADGRANSNLALQTSKLMSVKNGQMIGYPARMDNLLERFYHPRLNLEAGSGCSRTYKSAGNCDGITRLFRDDAQMINTACNKIQVVAPQSFPNFEGVRFSL